jgi:hypothetical protein
MKQPYYITSERLEDILEQQYGLHHRANRNHIWTLTDLLKQSVDTGVLYRIYEEGPIIDISLYAPPYIPILGATVVHTSGANACPRLCIPDVNYSNRFSMYIVDTAQWILWIQSAQDPTKVWAWEMNLDELGGIQPFCDAIRADGWYLTVTSTLRMHIRDWEESNGTASFKGLMQVPDTNVCFVRRTPTPVRCCSQCSPN